MYRVRLIDFPEHLVVNWAYSSRRRRVHLVNSPDRLVVIRLVATEFVSSTRETDSSRQLKNALIDTEVLNYRLTGLELVDRGLLLSLSFGVGVDDMASILFIAFSNIPRYSSIFHVLRTIRSQSLPSNSRRVDPRVRRDEICT